jgi:hypothetical protein
MMFFPLEDASIALSKNLIKHTYGSKDLSSYFSQLICRLCGLLDYVKCGRHSVLKLILYFFNCRARGNWVRGNFSKYISNILEYLKFDQKMLFDFILQMFFKQGVPNKLLNWGNVNNTIDAYIDMVLARVGKVIYKQVSMLALYKEVFHFLCFKMKFESDIKSLVQTNINHLIQS